MEKGTARFTQDERFKKMLVPTAAGLAGSALAVVLTKKPKQLLDAMPKQLDEVVPKVRDAMRELPNGGVGDLTDDLRGRLDSVLGKDTTDDDDDKIAGFERQQPSQFDASRFEQRRSERRERREQRRRRAA
jgi:hypothetical protein